MDSKNWQQIQRIFEVAIELPPQERDIYLDEACNGDTVLFNEIKAMLEADSKRNSLLDRPIQESFSSLLETNQIHNRIGSYQIMREIGSGGMGAVYLAKRVDGQFEQQVALKLIKPGMHSGNIINRFEHERQILAQLQHPNIARLLDGGVSDDGLPYFTMEYVSGMPIDQYCNHHNLTIDERVTLFMTVCQAVQFAHNNLIIHRDLKPGNIFVTDDGIVKLLDFGIAKVFDEDQDLSGLTRTGHYAMTPEYSSPEQIRHKHVTTATDVYSLGLILYELLTDNRPFKFSSSSLLDIEQIILNTKPDRPSTALRKLQNNSSLDNNQILQEISKHRKLSSDRLRRKLSGDLDNICMLALNKEPERRYASADQLGRDLERYLTGLPVRARKESMSYRAQKFMQRHRWGMLSSTFVSLALIGVVSYYTFLLSDQRDRAIAEAEKSKAVSTFLENLFKNADPSESKGSTITAREILDRGAGRIESELEEQPEIQATMFDVIGSVYYSLGLYEEAQPLFEKSLQIRQSIFTDDHPDIALSLSNLGYLFCEMGEYIAADSLLNRALVIDQMHLSSNDPEFAKVYGGLAWIFNLRGDYNKADSLYRKAIQIQTVNNNPEVGITYNNLALLMHEMNRYEDAEIYFKKSLEILREAYGDVHPEVSTTLYNYGQLQRDMDHIDEAIEIHRKVLKLDRQLYGEEHPYVAYSLNGLASMMDKIGNTEEAEKLYRQALDMRIKLLGNEHPDVGYSLNNLGRVLMKRKAYTEAEKLFFKALKIHRNANGEIHPAVASTLKNIGTSYYYQKKYLLSKRYLEKALDMCLNLLGEKHFTTANTMRVYSRTLSAMNNYDLAVHYAQTALNTAIELLGESHSFVKTCRKNLVQIHRDYGDNENADTLLTMTED
jgi:serine/threonine-protein kinase